MKAKIENGQVRRYIQLPKYYKQWGGNFDIQSDIIHEQEGFYNVEDTVFDADLQNRGDLYFDNSNNVFKYTITNKILPTLAEAKALKIQELKLAVRSLYETIQAYLTEKQLHEETPAVGIVNKIKEIRTKYQNIKGQIEALLTVEDVIKFALPYAQIGILMDELAAIEF